MKNNIKSLWKKVFASESITFKEMFNLALAGIPSQISNLMLYTLYLKYFTDVVGIRPTLVGTIFLILSIWNMINDPITGVWLDRMKYDPQKGKYVYVLRRVFLPIVLSAFGMIFVSGSWKEWFITTFLISLMVIYETAHTAYTISMASYSILRVTTSEERVEMSVISNYMANIFSFVVTLIPLFLLIGETNNTVVTVSLAVVTLLNALLYWISTRNIHDSPELYKSDIMNSDAQLVNDLKHYMGDLFKSKGFWLMRVYGYVASFGVGFAFTYFLYYMDHIIKGTSTQAFIIDTTAGILMFLVIPFLPALHRKLGVKKGYVAILLPATIGFALLYHVNSFWSLFAVYSLIIITHGSVSVMGAPIGGLIIDEDEQRSGVRKVGFFNSIGSLLMKPAEGLRTMVFTIVLTYYGYDGTLEMQSERAIEGLRVSSSIIPLMAMLLSIAIMLLLPYTREVEQRIRKRAIELHR